MPPITDFTQVNYQPLSPYKFLHHPERLKQFDTDPFQVSPVTAHLVPTLLCNQRCYFCTYGQYKEVGKSSGIRMELEDLKATIHQLVASGIKSIIFTGGGEPTLYPHLIEAMAFARKQGVDIALNTNGFTLSPALMDGILQCQPTYIRISLNAGRRKTQQLVTGRNNYEQVLDNIRILAKRKQALSSGTDLSVGYVVNIVNLFEIEDFVQEMLKLEQVLIREADVPQPIYSLQFRPVSNFEHSKHQSEHGRIQALMEYLTDLYGQAYAEELEGFLLRGEQTSSATMAEALKIIKEKVVSAVANSAFSRLNIVFPEQKFNDMISRSKKPYSRCLSCPWYLFIWPDGEVYHCVEWAGNKEFSIGNVFSTPLEELLRGDKRSEVLARINQTTIHSRCVTVCAHHEMNILLSRFSHADANCLRRDFETCYAGVSLRHENFL